MKIRYLIFAFIAFSEYSFSAHAFLGFSDTTVRLSYSCLGLDGVPISDAVLTGECCDGSGNLKANAPDSCRTSLYGSGVAEATSGTASNISIAQQTMDQANLLKGATTNYAASTPSPQVGSPIASTGGVSSALTAGTAGTGDPSGSSRSATVPSLSSGSRAGAGATNADAAGGGSGAGGGLAPIGTTGGTGANLLAAAAIDPNADSAAGSYGKNDGAGDGNKPSGGLYGSLFGNGAGGKVDGDLKNAQFDGETASDSGSGDGAGGENAANNAGGSTLDPADYFSRIDSSASIFKVVSRRYIKEAERKHLGLTQITK